MSQSVLLIGATGNIGSHIAEGLVRHKSSFSKLAAFTTEESLNNSDKKKQFDKITEQGFSVVVGDLDNKQSLINAFKGFDVIVSSIGGALVPKQTEIIDAAAEAGVKRFYPSEFGTDTTTPFYRTLTALQGKVKIQEYLEQVVEKYPNFTYSLFLTGAFSEWVPSQFFKFDFKNHTFEVIGDESALDAKFATTSFKDISEFLVQSILHPEVGRNGAVSVASEHITWRQVIALFEKYQNVKYTVSFVPIEEIKKREIESLQQGKYVDALVLQIRRLVTSGHVDFKQTDNSRFKQFETESFESVVKKIIAQLNQ